MKEKQWWRFNGTLIKRSVDLFRVPLEIFHLHIPVRPGKVGITYAASEICILGTDGWATEVELLFPCLCVFCFPFGRILTPKSAFVYYQFISARETVSLSTTQLTSDLEFHSRLGKGVLSQSSCETSGEWKHTDLQTPHEAQQEMVQCFYRQRPSRPEGSLNPYSKMFRWAVISMYIFECVTWPGDHLIINHVCERWIS